MIVVGIDPDSTAHGVATYIDGELEELEQLNNLQIVNRLASNYWGKSPVFSIENVNGVSAAFGARDARANINVKLKMAQHIGMCKQSQIELQRALDSFGIHYKRHKISKLWKKDKEQFQRITGWSGLSNEDTRSAAYFGFLEAHKGGRPPE